MISIAFLRIKVILLLSSTEGAKKEIVAGFPLTPKIVRWSCRLRQKSGLISSKTCLKNKLSF